MQRTYTNFSGGQNTQQGQYASPVLLDNGDLEALAFAEKSINWKSTENGLKKWAGYDSILTSVSSTTATVTGGYEWNGSRVLAVGTKLYTVNISTGATTEIYSGVTAGAFFQFTEWDDGDGTEILVICNGVDHPLIYNATTCVTIGAVDPSGIWNSAKPFCSAVFRGRIFYATTQQILTPNPGTYNDFDDAIGEADAFTVDAGFGGNITGLKSLTDDMLVIYKERCIRRLSGTDPFDATNGEPFRIREVTNDFGCVAPRTLVQVGLDHYFLSDSGIRRLRPIQSYGDIDPSEPSYSIQDVILDLNYSGIDEACALFHRPEKKIWFSVPRGTSAKNTQIIVHDVVTGANDLRREGDIGAACLFDINRQVYHGGYDGQLYAHNGALDNNGVVINAEWESKFIAHNGIGTFKRYREMHIYADSEGEGTLVIQWQVLRRGSVIQSSETRHISVSSSRWDIALWDISPWTNEGQQNVFKIRLNARGKAIKFRFLNVSRQIVNIRQVDLFYDVFSTARG